MLLITGHLAAEEREASCYDTGSHVWLWRFTKRKWGNRLSLSFTISISGLYKRTWGLAPSYSLESHPNSLLVALSVPVIDSRDSFCPRTFLIDCSLVNVCLSLGVKGKLKLVIWRWGSNLLEMNRRPSWYRRGPRIRPLIWPLRRFQLHHVQPKQVYTCVIDTFGSCKHKHGV